MFKKDSLLKSDISTHSPHVIIPSLIRHRSLVLDVGANTCFLAKELLKKHVRTDCVDINEAALEAGKKYCRECYRRGLSTGTLSIKKELYDYIIFADLLEHLPRPDMLLLDARQYIKKMVP